MLLPGVKEAADEFWNHYNTRRPEMIPDAAARDFVGECLLLALARLRLEVAPGSASTPRAAAADQAYDLYDHGDMVLVNSGPWWVMGDVWRKVALVGDDFRPVDPKPLVFVVRFRRGTDEVAEAYYDVRP